MSPDTQTKYAPRRFVRWLGGLVGIATAVAVIGTAATAVVPAPDEGMQSNYPVAAQVLEQIAPEEASAAVDPGDLPKIVNTADSAFSIKVYPRGGCKGKASKVKPNRSKRGNSLRVPTTSWVYWGKSSKKLKSGQCLTTRTGVRVVVSGRI